LSDVVKLIVGRTAKDVAADFLSAWKRAELGETVRERVLSFENWEGLAAVMTGERYRLLRYLHGHPEPSVSSLARALGRQYRRVHEDVVALEGAGLVVRGPGEVRATADRIEADIRL
jgi:predicted transcriptional regulator